LNKNNTADVILLKQMEYTYPNGLKNIRTIPSYEYLCGEIDKYFEVVPFTKNAATGASGRTDA
jgi:hypothetical protein